MASNDPRDEKKPEPSGSEADPGADALSRLEERLGRASDAAERLIAEAAGEAARGPRTPPAAGWQTPEDEEHQSRRGRGELETLLAAIGSLRELIPPDLQRRLADALRELLLAVRALIDWYLERAKQVRAEPAEVQDIPIA
jgi:hypothetical protein